MSKPKMLFSDTRPPVWLSVQDILKFNLPGVPGTARNINMMFARMGGEEMLRRKRVGRGGGYVYHYTMLPPRALAAYLRLAEETGKEG